MDHPTEAENLISVSLGPNSRGAPRMIPQIISIAAADPLTDRPDQFLGPLS